MGKIPLEEGLATHSSILTWEITWTEGPGELQSIGSQKLDVTEHTHTQERPSLSEQVKQIDISQVPRLWSKSVIWLGLCALGLAMLR